MRERAGEVSVSVARAVRDRRAHLGFVLCSPSAWQPPVASSLRRRDDPRSLV